MSSQKELGIQLPPLLPLEYCTVERAARLLGCEEEDIYHWHEVGAISLCVKLEDENCRPNIWIKTEDGTMSLSEKKVLEKEGSLDAFVSTHSILGGIYFDPSNSDSWMFGFSGFANGFWKIRGKTENGNWLLTTVGEIEYKPTGEGLEHVTLLSIDLPPIEGERYVFKPDLERLHRAIHGIETLSNRYNNREIAENMRQAELETQNARPHRVEKKQAHLIRLLIESHPNLGAEVIENPYAACDVLEAQFARDGIGPIDANPVTVGNWISGKRKK